MIVLLGAALTGCSIDLGDTTFADACDSDAACPQGEVCRWGVFGNACSAAGVCASDADCGSGAQCRVHGGFTFDPGPTRTTCESRLCNADVDCAPGQICQGGFLSEATCSAGRTCDSQAQCQPEEVCRVRNGWDAKGPSRTTCESWLCMHDVDCPVGQFCDPLFGDCHASTCTSDADCANGEHCFDPHEPADPTLDRRTCV